MSSIPVHSPPPDDLRAPRAHLDSTTNQPPHPGPLPLGGGEGERQRAQGLPVASPSPPPKGRGGWPVVTVEMPRATTPNGKLSPAETEAIGLFVHISRMLGQPKSSAEVYGVLFVSPRPLPVEDVADRLGTSTETVHAAFRFLRRAGLLRMVHVPGNRRLHYEAVPELQHMVGRFVRDEAVPQLANAEDRMRLLAECVNELPKEQRGRLGGRVAALERWGRITRELASGFLGLLEES